jgi:HAE1 family hydrophobic/amphiphilic exporter-1
MYISDTAITKPVLTVVAMLMFVVFGIVALTQLDTDEYPEIDAPVVVVAVPYPGASPDIVEREVVDPIEEAVSGISGIDRMRSSSLDSYASIVVEFDFSKDPKVATQEIRDKISSIRNDLPTEMEEPILTQFDPADRPIVSLTLSSPGLTGAELTRMADPDITRRLRGITGVATVNLVGSWWWRSGRAISKPPASASDSWCRRCSRRTWRCPWAVSKARSRSAPSA